jgi:glycosyl transferase family 2
LTTHRPRVTEVAFAKNEGRFFLEWIAYHRLIGVEDFLIYTNDCEDESPALLDRLEEMGIVAHLPNPKAPGEPAQNKALSAALDHPLVKRADYILQIDPDEFLVVKAGTDTIHDLIATAPDAEIISVQMRFFGDNGLARLAPDALVTESLTMASREDFEHNAIVKSLARNDPRFEKVTANHMPVFDAARGWVPRVFNGGGEEVPPDAFHRERFRQMPEGYRSTRNAQLNHYCVKTLADFRAKKHRGTAANNDKKLHMDFFNRRNRNEVREATILTRLPAVKALMAEWLEDSVLATRNRRCTEAYEEILRKSENILGA